MNRKKSISLKWIQFTKFNCQYISKVEEKITNVMEHQGQL